METTDLSSAEYWESDDVDIRLNPAANIDTTGLNEALDRWQIKSAIVLATSGTSGRSKLVVLPKSAMLCSAKAVNEWCGITWDDIWLGGLSTFHVGGLGIFCRACLSGSKVHPMAWNEWTRDGKAFLSAIRDATVTSLTPVHLHDLVTARVRCPRALRGVFIGGGALSGELAEKAGNLDWPLWTTYGMTEACSQIATSLDGNTASLPILPHWETMVSDRGELMIKGPALMSGYFDEQWEWHTPEGGKGFYTTGDLVEISGKTLRPLGRADNQVKILGELVSPGKLEQSLSRKLAVPVVVFHIPDPRRGAELVAVIESESEMVEAFEEWNQSRPPFQRIAKVHRVKEFPMTEVGKNDRKALAGRFGG